MINWAADMVHMLGYQWGTENAFVLHNHFPGFEGGGEKYVNFAHITIHTQCMIIYNIQEHILAHF